MKIKKTIVILLCSAAGVLLLAGSFFAGRYSSSGSMNTYPKLILDSFADGRDLVLLHNGRKKIVIGEDHISQRVDYLASAANGANRAPLFDKVLKESIDSAVILEEIYEKNLLLDEKFSQKALFNLEKSLINAYFDYVLEMNHLDKIEISDSKLEEFYKSKEDYFKSKNISREKAILTLRNEFENIKKREMARKKEAFSAMELGKLKKKYNVEIDYKKAGKIQQ